MSIHEAATPKKGVAPDVFLFVGDLELWLATGHRVPEMRQAHFSNFEDVTPHLLDVIKPDVIVSPLFANSFDASELAVRLRDLGFSGKYRALSPPLPRPRIILREIRALVPRLNFDLYVLEEPNQTYHQGDADPGGKIQ